MTSETYNRSYESVIEDLPSSIERIKNSEAVLILRLQAWVNDRARDVDRGPYEYTVPLIELYDEESEEWVGIHESCGHWVGDEFIRHTNAPDVGKEWTGPFEIKLKSWRVKE